MKKNQREVNHDGILSVIFKQSCLSWCRDSADYMGRLYWASMSLMVNFIGRSRSSWGQCRRSMSCQTNSRICL